VGLSPLPVPPHVFAVEPGGLAYGRFERSGPGFELAAWGAVELPADSFQEGLLGGPAREPRRLSEAIAALVKELPGGIRAASLVVPDAWLRVAFAEGGDLPGPAAAREEVLRWKLKRLVPFRVEELRVAGAEVAPLNGDGTPRLLLGFALDVLLSQLEAAFAGEAIEIGQVSNRSLSLLAAVEETAASGELVTLAVATGDGYTLAFARRGAPILHRYKPMPEGTSAAARAALVRRDLRLTRSFLDEQLPDAPRLPAIVAAPPDLEPIWLEWISQGLGASAEPLAAGHLPPLALAAPGHSAIEIGPLLGAAAREVP
jgi:hypothetical protein